MMLGNSIKDNLSGYLVMKRKAWDAVKEKSDFIFRGYGEFCIRLIYYMSKYHITMKEIPVHYNARLGGESKTLFIKHFIDYLVSVVELRFKND